MFYNLNHALCPGYDPIVLSLNFFIFVPSSDEKTMGDFDQAGTAVLVVSQLLFLCVGIITNSLLLATIQHTLAITIQDTLTIYQVLLANLAVANLVECAIIMPIASIYIGYAFSKALPSVGLPFCQVFTFLSGTLLPITPLTVLALAWEVWGQGDTTRLLGREAGAINNLHNSDEVNTLAHMTEKTKSQEKNLRKRILVLIIWSAGAVIELEGLSRTQQEYAVRETFVLLHTNYKNLTRYR